MKVWPVVHRLDVPKRGLHVVRPQKLAFRPMHLRPDLHTFTLFDVARGPPFPRRPEPRRPSF
jgi:hypothetical protein